MSEHRYESSGKSIVFSDNNDMTCLCTFPGNNTENGKIIIDEDDLLCLATLGCAVCLLHNKPSDIKEHKEPWLKGMVVLPQDIGKYKDAIIKCIRKIKED